MKIFIDKDLEDIFPGYLENRHKEVLELRELIAAKDLKKLQVISHRLAGNAGSYGLAFLSEVGSRMEADCMKGSLSGMDAYLKAIEDYLRELTYEYR
jgi:HPt (histidine-containing phosphotransfer) domain-containing protein